MIWIKPGWIIPADTNLSCHHNTNTVHFNSHGQSATFSFRDTKPMDKRPEHIHEQSKKGRERDQSQVGGRKPTHLRGGPHGFLVLPIPDQVLTCNPNIQIILQSESNSFCLINMLKFIHVCWLNGLISIRAELHTKIISRMHEESYPHNHVLKFSTCKPYSLVITRILCFHY